MNKTLLIDMDAIIVDMVSIWLDKYNQATGENVKLADVEDYDLGKICKNTKVLYDILNEPGFFFDMEPMPHAVEAVNELIDEGYEVIVVTQPPRSASVAVRDKRRWIKKYFPDFDLQNMVFCHKKYLIGGDLIFDDKPDHLVSWKRAHPFGLTTTLDWKYNRLPEVNRIINFRGSLDKGWLDFVDFVKTNLPLK